LNPVKNILSLLRKDPNVNKPQSSEGFCPNCWGRQEYGGNFYKALKTENIKDLMSKKGWITSYVERNLKGIHVQNKENKQVCNVCFECHRL